MSKCINIFIGFDQKEAIAYHTFSQSLIERSSVPLSITPLADNTLNIYKEKHTDGSNAFIYSRFLVPYLSNFKGKSVFLDGDMVINDDLNNLFNEYDDKYAVQVVGMLFVLFRKWYSVALLSVTVFEISNFISEIISNVSEMEFREK